MKYPTLLFPLIIICGSIAAYSISVEDFKKLGYSARVEAIDNAAAEQKDELKRIHVHLQLVAKLGGEEEVRRQKETLVTADRGFPAIENLFATQVNYWENYVVGVESVYRKAGAIDKELTVVMNDLGKKVDDLVKRRVITVHSLAFNLAPSPEAQNFERKVENLGRQLEEKFAQTVSVPRSYVTKDQLKAVDEQVDRVFAELKELPKLGPAEVQREYDAYPEEKVALHFRHLVP